MTDLRGRSLLLLPQLRLIVALLVLLVAFASGTSVAEAGNGVAAINSDSGAAVEAVGDVTAGHAGSETGLFDDGVSGCCVAPTSAGSTFYTVQSADDAARLSAGGTPWPTSPTRAEFGPGVYAWGSADDAASYAARLEGRGACVQVCEFTLDTGGLNRVDVDSLADPPGFMSKYSQLWGGTPNHGLDYITRGTQYGTQHYFSPDAFSSATWIGPR